VPPADPPPGVPRTQARRPLSLKARAIQWLSQREHSREELRRKLRRALREQQAAAASAPPEADLYQSLDELLDELQAKGYLSDTRFAASRVHTRAGRYGRQRIVQELAQHGVRLDAAADEALKASELARAQAVWARRFGGVASEPAERARQMRFLAGRGFAMDVIHRVVRGQGEGEGEGEG
jgi:regulatory protein